MGSSVAPVSSRLMVNLFDGARQPLSDDVKVLITIFDGNKKQIHRDFHSTPSILFDLPFYDGIGDNYTVIAWADGYLQAGFMPVPLSPKIVQHIDLMLLPANGGFNFGMARWPSLRASYPQLYALLSHGAASDADARDRYRQKIEDDPAAAACFFNITTALAAINLPAGTPLDYFKEVIWDGRFRQDRFFAWASRDLLDQVQRATQQGLFSPEESPGVFHPGATSSYKQIQFGEANVQLTFHESDTNNIDGIDCVMVEPDIDYYKDLAAHALLEVVVNGISGGLTDPKQVYVLRWMAGRHAGVPEFNPPYIIA